MTTTATHTLATHGKVLFAPPTGGRLRYMARMDVVRNVPVAGRKSRAVRLPAAMCREIAMNLQNRSYRAVWVAA